MSEECLFQACYCMEDSCFKPKMEASCLGYYSSSLMCCNFSKSSICICKGHKAFDTMVDGRDDVICMSQNASFLVKPLCLDGSKPVCKANSTGCCCSSRCAYPLDQDITSRCAAYALKCCDCNPMKFDPKCMVPIDAIPEYANPNLSPRMDDAFFSSLRPLSPIGLWPCSKRRPIPAP